MNHNALHVPRHPMSLLQSVTSPELSLCHEHCFDTASCNNSPSLPIERVHSSNGDQNLSRIKSFEMKLMPTQTCRALREKSKCSGWDLQAVAIHSPATSIMALTSNRIFPHFSVQRSLPVAVACAPNKARREQIRLSGTTVSQTPYEQVGGQWTARTLKFEGRKNFDLWVLSVEFVRGGFNCSYKYCALRRPGVHPAP